MTTLKKLGIWIDHSNAHIMEFKNETIETNIVSSKFTHQGKEQSLVKGENLMHNKEKHQQLEYYKKLGEIIKNFDNVVLFGPTDAKSELLNLLRADQRFTKITIDVKQTDKLTQNQQLAFFKDHFSKQM